MSELENHKKLIKMLDELEKKYPSGNIRSLDNWDEEGFPEEIVFTVANVPKLTSNNYKRSFAQRNKYLKRKYGFEIEIDSDYAGSIFYNTDLRSICGEVENYDETDESELIIHVHTSKYGISPVGSDAEHVRNLINDSIKIVF